MDKDVTNGDKRVPGVDSEVPGLAQDALIKVHVERAVKETLLRLARKGDRSLSAEVRRALREHVRRSPLGEVVADGSPRELEAEVAPVRRAARALAPSRDPVAPASPSGEAKPARTAMCEHRVRPGAFCKRCDGASLATGADAAVSAGLAVSSAPVASDGALAEPGEPLSEGGIATRSGGLRSPVGEAVGHGLPGSANALTFVPPSLKQSVTTAGDLAKRQVTPHLKSEQAGRKK